MINEIKNIYTNSRFSTWWHHIIAPLSIGLYISFFYTSTINYFLYFSFFIASFFSALTGYLINDYFDIEKDRQVGKNNFFNLHFKKQGSLLLLALFFTSYLMWYFVPVESNNKFLILFLQQLLLVLYSYPKFRLKENPILGVVLDMLYAKVLPWIMIMLVGGFFANTHIIYSIMFWVIPFGLRTILHHQYEDFEKDKLNTTTFVIKFSKSVTNKVIAVLSIIEIIALLIALFFWEITLSNKWFTISVLLAFILGMVYESKQYLNQKKSLNANFFLNNLYEYLLPFTLALNLSVLTKNYWFILIHLILFPKIILYLWQIIKRKKAISFSKPKLAVNYIIYYFFLIFGVDLKKENKSAIQYFKQKFRR